MTLRHTDRKPGWQARKMKADQKKAREQAAAKRGQAMTVGKGGITVKDGGALTAQYPNNVGGGRGVQFGPLPKEESDSGPAVGLQVDSEVGRHIFQALRQYPTDDYPTGQSAVAVEADLFIVVGGSNPTIYNADLTCSVNIGVGAAKAVIIQAGSGGVLLSHSTTGASANAFLDPSDGRIWRSTSSLRYKQDVADLAIDPDAVLALRPRMWRDKAEVEQDADTETYYVGFIAEELHDLGLTAFVIYDDEGKPEAIAYDRLSAATVSLAQQQQREINDLKQQLASLAERVGALESSR